MSLPADDELVFVPARFREDNGQMRSADIETGLLLTGERFGLGFSSRAALQKALGAGKRWVAMPMLRYATLLRDQGIARVELDPLLADQTGAL